MTPMTTLGSLRTICCLKNSYLCRRSPKDGSDGARYHHSTLQSGKNKSMKQGQVLLRQSRRGNVKRTAIRRVTHHLLKLLPSPQTGQPAAAHKIGLRCSKRRARKYNPPASSRNQASKQNSLYRTASHRMLLATTKAGCWQE